MRQVVTFRYPTMANDPEYDLGNTRNSVHFVCFDCRVCFKQPNSSNWDSTLPERPFPCPECREQMHAMGRHFKAPPRRDKRQWLKVELLYHYGERFVASNSDLGRSCATLSDTVTYLTGPYRSLSEVRQVLHAIRGRKAIRANSNPTRE